MTSHKKSHIIFIANAVKQFEEKEIKASQSDM